MTVQSSNARDEYIGDGLTSIFPVTFKFQANDELGVYQKDTSNIETKLILISDYTVTGAGNETGGEITLVAGNLPAGYLLVIIREVPLNQQTDYVENDNFPADSHEAALDKLTMISQQQQEELGRVLIAPVTGQIPAETGNKYYAGPNETDHGATGSGSSLKDYIDAIPVGQFSTVVFLHSVDAAQTVYDFLTSIYVPYYIFVEFEPGALQKPDAGVTITYDSPSNIVVSPDRQSIQQIFDISLNSVNPVSFVNGGTVHVDWFDRNITPGTTDMYDAINCAYGSIQKGTVLFQSEVYGIGTGLLSKEFIEYLGAGEESTEIRALSAIDMITVASDQYHYYFRGLYFNGNNIATTGLKLGEAATQSGFVNFSDIQISNCAIGIDASFFFYSDFDRVQIRNCNDTALKVTRGQFLRMYVWLHDNVKDIVFDNLVDSYVHVVAYTDTPGFVRSIELTNNCHGITLSGQLEPRVVASVNELILIDDNSQYNKIIDLEIYPNISPQDSIDFDLIRIGNVADSGPSIGNVIENCKFFGVDFVGGFYHVRLDYSAATVIENCQSSEPKEAIVIYENPNDQGRCSHTVYRPISGEDNIVRFSSDVNLTPQHMGRIIEVTTGAGDVTITMPMCEFITGREITIVKIDSGSGNVIVQRFSGTENFQPGNTGSVTITSQYDYKNVYSNGEDFIIRDQR